jgi:hypothetical protein
MFHATIDAIPGPQRKTAIGAVRAAMSSLYEVGSTVNVEMFEGPPDNQTRLFSCPSTNDPETAVNEMMHNLRRRYK